MTMTDVKWQAAGACIQGGRHYQEDAFGIEGGRAAGGDSQVLLILADGMGGHAGGAVASALAIEHFHRAVAAGAEDIETRLARALVETNEAIGARATTDAELAGMGCTLVAAWMNGPKLTWISVGDSPLWLYDGARLSRLNEDHSMAPVLAQRVDRGEITEGAAARHPARNALRSAVTGDEINLVDLAHTSVPIAGDAVVILASDGLLTLTEEEIAAQLHQCWRQAPAQIVARLLEAVAGKKQQDQDNTTVVVAQTAATAR